MATKNRIVHTLWIIQGYEIPRAKASKQNCLGCVLREQVGIITNKKLCAGGTELLLRSLFVHIEVQEPRLAESNVELSWVL